MAAARGERPASPCIGVCQLTDEQLCQGCGRTLSEIADWAQASAEQQQLIVTRSRERMRQRRAEPPPSDGHRVDGESDDPGRDH